MQTCIFDFPGSFKRIIHGFLELHMVSLTSFLGWSQRVHLRHLLCTSLYGHVPKLIQVPQPIGHCTASPQPRFLNVAIFILRPSTSPGCLFYDEDGETKVDLVRLKDAKFDNADYEAKLQMTEHLKNLRLVLWLLRKQNYLSYTEQIPTRGFKSGLASQASLTSKWLCSVSWEHLRDILPKRAGMLPTSARRDWLLNEDWNKAADAVLCTRVHYFPIPEGEYQPRLSHLLQRAIAIDHMIYSCLHQAKQ